MRSIASPNSLERFILREQIYRVRRAPYGDPATEELPVRPNADLAIIKVPEGGIPGLNYTEFDDEEKNGEYQLGKAYCTFMQLYVKNEVTYINDPIEDNLQVIADEIPSPIVPEGDQSYPQFLEWVHNPYAWKHYGSIIPMTPDTRKMKDGKKPTFFTVAYRERTGLWVCGRPPDILKCVTTEQVAIDQSGTVKIWMGGAETTETETAWLNWMHGGQKISANIKALIRFFEDENKWVFIGADCETTT